MQDAFNRDMFNISDVNNPRYNGHVQVSPCGKSAGGKRDRKGCTKGKIEAIMKNNIVRPKVCITSNSNKKSPPTLASNHVLYTNHHHTIKAEDQEDPYTFTEPEPQALSVYQHQPGSSNKKSPSTVRISSSNMVCSDKTKHDQARVVLKTVKPPDVTSKMSKLQADIARNKVIGKRRKLEQVPPRGKTGDWNNVNIKRDPNKICIPAKREARKSTWQRERNSKHELLQRIHQIKNNLKQYSRDLYPLGLELSDSDSDDLDNDKTIYEHHWFSKSDIITDDMPRERRVEASRAQMRRRLAQTIKGLKVSEDPSSGLLAAVVAAARRFPNATAAILNPSIVKPAPKVPKGAQFLTTGEKCSYSEGCNWQALPCTRHCSQHIMYNVDQRLFQHCTGRGPDNTQCNRPVFDIRHDPPLCPQHAQHHDSLIRSHAEQRHSRKVNKKNRLIGLSRNSKRNNKKRKKLVSHSTERLAVEHTATPPPPPLPSPSPQPVPTQIEISCPIETVHPQAHTIEPIIETSLPTPALHTEGEIPEEVSEEVLAIASLDPAELASQATRLLEEHDLTNVLNQISTDAFNDLFTDKNGEYEPTREETEELERALEAVDNDVRSLERMSRSLPLLQLPLPLDMGLLDDASPAGPFPTFQNGFPPPPTTTDIHHS